MKEMTTNVGEILAHSALFKMLDARQLDEIAANTYSLRAGPNMRIVKPGDTGEGTYWIAYGQVKIFFYPQKGCEKTVEILGDGTCFGVGEMLSGKPHLAYVKTTTDCLVLHVGRDAMLQTAQENFGFARELMSCAGRQFHGLMRDIERYSQTSRQRLAGYLLKQRSNAVDEHIELVANRALISSLLWFTPETLSRLFHDFSTEGLIEVSGRHVKILDCERMSALI
jgi:CRP-like cAMP-binding protein